jgi:hypothetical protein
MVLSQLDTGITLFFSSNNNNNNKVKKVKAIPVTDRGGP